MSLGKFVFIMTESRGESSEKHHKHLTVEKPSDARMDSLLKALTIRGSSVKKQGCLIIKVPTPRRSGIQKEMDRYILLN